MSDDFSLLTFFSFLLISIQPTHSCFLVSLGRKGHPDLTPQECRSRSDDWRRPAPQGARPEGSRRSGRPPNRCDEGRLTPPHTRQTRSTPDTRSPSRSPGARRGRTSPVGRRQLLSAKQGDEKESVFRPESHGSHHGPFLNKSHLKTAFTGPRL